MTTKLTLQKILKGTLDIKEEERQSQTGGTPHGMFVWKICTPIWISTLINLLLKRKEDTLQVIKCYILKTW
jgi:hypothetical protein